MSENGTLTEADIFADVIGLDHGNLSPEVARTMLRWRFSRKATTRMTRLAARANKGTITDIEREELDRFVRVGMCVNVMQAQARLSLKTARSLDA